MKTSVIDYIINTTDNFPEKSAVIDKEGFVSFGELLSYACDLAEELGKYNLKKEPVAVLLPKGWEMVCCFAGINLNGSFYVPVDISQPTSRLENILNVLGCKLIITRMPHNNCIPASWDGFTIFIDEIFNNKDNYNRARDILRKSATIDTDPVYSIFTSGSTGIPKGVVVNHRGVIDYIDWAVETFGINKNSVIGNQAPFYFDNSTLDIYLMYATGATLNIIPEEKFAFPATLMDYLNDNKITFVFWVPFVLINVANFKILDSKQPLYLKDVFFAGEVMPNRQLNYWRNHLPDCRYVNLYGPTEITVDCTYYIVDRKFADDEPLPIGFPCKNTDIIILKDRKQKCVPNETGEICVRGSSLANGYYNNPDKTKDAFIQNPLNRSYPELIYCTGDLGYFNERGEIMFVGRADTQIKHKGYRIELGEIENAVLGSELVEEGCVIYDIKKQRITLIYSNPSEITIASVRTSLKDKIPSYMLPSSYIREEKLKRNQNGKIDRAYYNSMING